MGKSRRIRWLGLVVAHVREERDAYTFCSGKPESDRLDMDG